MRRGAVPCCGAWLPMNIPWGREWGSVLPGTSGPVRGDPCGEKAATSGGRWGRGGEWEGWEEGSWGGREGGRKMPIKWRAENNSNQQGCASYGWFVLLIWFLRPAASAAVLWNKFRVVFFFCFCFTPQAFQPCTHGVCIFQFAAAAFAYLRN